MSALIAWDLASKKSANALYNYIWWRRWELHPRPKWIPINVYVCRYLFAQLTQEISQPL